MGIGQAVVDAIKTRGGDNTTYTIGQASDIMCKHIVYWRLHFEPVCQACRHVFVFNFYFQLWV